MLRHAADEDDFGFGFRFVFGEEPVEEGVLFFDIFVLEEIHRRVAVKVWISGQTVRGSVLGRCLFASGRSGAGGFLCVLPIGENLRGCCHMFSFYYC